MDDSEEFFIRNTDTDEILTPDDVGKFSLVTLGESKVDNDKPLLHKNTSNDDDEDDDDDGDDNDVKDEETYQYKDDDTYIPLSCPSGGRITFNRIAAVGNSQRYCQCHCYYHYYH